ncbi:MAG: hypothetical protein ACRC1U_10585, partial [Vibrionaceae bacterium]
YPIYKFAGQEGCADTKFTLDFRYGDDTADRPPTIEHHPGKIHQGMDNALWAAFCYDNPAPGNNTLANYEALCRGIMWRYAGEGKEPEYEQR